MVCDQALIFKKLTIIANKNFNFIFLSDKEENTRIEQKK
jgi:hypothetical protein